VTVGVGVGVGVWLQFNNISSSQPVESVAITNTSPYKVIPSNSGTLSTNVGGTDTTPVITV
jgi:hypothetical protein